MNGTAIAVPFFLIRAGRAKKAVVHDSSMRRANDRARGETCSFLVAMSPSLVAQNGIRARVYCVCVMSMLDFRV